MFDALQTQTLPEPQRVAFYGALFAMAALDQGIDPEEWALIYDQLDTHGLSEPAEARLKSFILAPPRLMECLVLLAQAEEPVRFGTMINLLDVAYADEHLADAEAEALDEAAAILRVDPFQVDAMRDFIEALRRIRRQGQGEGAAVQAVSLATEHLYAAGIPPEAVRFSSAFLYEPSVQVVTGAHPTLSRP